MAPQLLSAATSTSTDATMVSYKPLVTVSIGTSNVSTNTTGTQPLSPTMNTATATSGTQRNVTYNLDKAGNRLSLVDIGVTKTYSPNNLNEYTSAEGSTVSNNNHHEISSYQGITYGYINDEHFNYAAAGPDSYSVYYDALGRCVKRWYDGSSAYYIYDGEKSIVEVFANGALLAGNLYGKGIDEILGRADYTFNPAVTYYYQQDHEGSVTHLTDGSGNVIEKYRYDAFGAPTYYNGSGAQIGSSNYDNRFLFTGREFMGVWYEYRARMYHPGIGRFTSEDPKGFDAGDYNLYRYCHNDPLDLTDPMGLLIAGVSERIPPIPELMRQAQQGLNMAYARGSGFTDKQWDKFNQAQQAAATRIEKAAAKMDSKTFEKVFGKGSATAENMAKVSQTMKGMATALRDDGTKGYVANAMSEQSRILGRGVVGGKTIWVNVDHPSYGSRSALTWATGHESAHNVGLGHGTVNGVTAYKYGNDAERDAYKNLPPADCLGNPDNYMDFAR
jgi:RHS repeat-associated protein